MEAQEEIAHRLLGMRVTDGQLEPMERFSDYMGL